MQHALALSLSLSLLAVVGCNGQTGSLGPTRPPVRLQVEPVDGTSSVKGSVLAVLIGDQVEAPEKREEEVAAELVKTVTLKTWPELEPVPNDVAIVKEHSGLRIVISSPKLAQDRWYAMIVSPPAGSSFGYRKSILTPEGATVSRFSIGPAALLITATIAQKGPETTALYLEFSEPLKDMELAFSGLEVQGMSGTSISCKLNASSAPSRNLGMVCSEALFGKDVKVTFKNVIETVGGATLPPRGYDLSTKGALETCGQFCAVILVQ